MGNKKSKKTKQDKSMNAALQMQRMISWNAYSDFLKTADAKIMCQFHKATHQVQFMFWMSTVMNILVFIFAAVALFFGLVNTFQQNWKHAGIAISLISLMTLFVVLYRSPLKDVRHALSNLTKTQIIFLGYVQQIDQINSAYKQIMFSSDSVNLSEMQESIQNIQDAVEQSVDEMMRSVEEMSI